MKTPLIILFLILLLLLLHHHILLLLLNCGFVQQAVAHCTSLGMYSWYQFFFYFENCEACWKSVLDINVLQFSLQLSFETFYLYGKYLARCMRKIVKVFM